MNTKLMTRKVLLFGLLVLSAVLIFAGQANAQLTYYFGDYSLINNPPQWDGVAPDGTWATATFMDDGDNVSLALAVDSNLPNGQFIGQWFFNYDGIASSLSIDDYGGGATTTTIGQNNDTYPAGGSGGQYDLWFEFAPAGNNKLTAGESVNYTIYDVTPSDFYLSNSVGYYAAAKLQGIWCDQAKYPECAAEGGTTSTWSAGVVPEPVSSTLFVVGAATLGFRRFRKRFKK